MLSTQGAVNSSWYQYIKYNRVLLSFEVWARQGIDGQLQEQELHSMSESVSSQLKLYTSSRYVWQKAFQNILLISIATLGTTVGDASLLRSPYRPRQGAIATPLSYWRVHLISLLRASYYHSNQSVLFALISWYVPQPQLSSRRSTV
jgi:hypothetical protein